jgi:hypothetical protein
LTWCRACLIVQEKQGHPWLLAGLYYQFLEGNWWIIWNETCTSLWHFPLNLVCLFSWIWVVQCFLQGGGGLVKIQWLFFANQFIHYLKKCEVFVEGEGTNVFCFRKVCVVHSVWTIGLNLEGCIMYISRVSVGICLNLDTLLHIKSKWRTKIR